MITEIILAVMFIILIIFTLIALKGMIEQGYNVYDYAIAFLLSASMLLTVAIICILMILRGIIF